VWYNRPAHQRTGGILTDKKNLSEQEIRTQYITPAIRAAGWLSAQIREEYAITNGRIVARGGICRRDRSLFADYILFYKPHIPLAVVEAKDNNHSIGDGIQQALDYAERMMIPFVFSSNGDGFVFHNRLNTNGDKETAIDNQSFLSPEALWILYKQSTGMTQNVESVSVQPYYTEREEKSPRYYQLNAINLTVNAITGGQNRVLLVMATGTGKTYTAFQIIWRLWKAGVKKRILFLADRNALIDQTYIDDFSPFKDKMTIVKNRRVDKSYEIYLAIYQGLTGEGDKNIFTQFSRSFFDLIIVDECHRGSAKEDSQWREVLEYFSPATQIGMTATPKESKDISNIDYFGNPIYTYSLKQGIEDGFLAPYRVIRILLDKDAEGYRPYEGQVDKLGNEIPDREYNISDYDRKLVLEPRTRMVAKVVSNYLKQRNLRMDKSIFFCVDTEHADRMRQALVNENADLVTDDDRYVMRITGDDPIGKKSLESFCDKVEPYPVLVTTSKLLSTGVNTRMVKFIVLDSNIRSLTEFKQIIGRGTRVEEEHGKMFFTIFDFRGVTRLFADPEFDGECEQNDEFIPNDDGELPILPDELPPTDRDFPPDEDPPIGSRQKFYVQDVQVTVLKERIQYIDNNGKLITESLIDFTRKNMRHQYATLEDFLSESNAQGRKQIIFQKLAQEGILVEELQEQIGQEYDPFDLLCHVAFDMPPLTRRERANRVKKKNYFAKYGEQAAVILEALLDKYADAGIVHLESMDVLKVSPLRDFGTPIRIVRDVFKGRDNFERAVRELEYELYAA